MSNGKTVIILLIAWLIKKISLYKMSFFPETYTHSRNKIKVWLDLSNYEIKSNLKSAAGGDTSKSEIKYWKIIKSNKWCK